MANISAVKIVRHVVTQADFDGGQALVQVLWDSPFNDTNYAVGCVVEADTAGSLLSNEIGSIFNVTPRGFTVLVTIYAQGAVGLPVVIHAIASHK